jgi:hypothetical protein
MGELLLPNDAKVHRINLWRVIPIGVAPLSSPLAPWLARYHLETKTLDTPWDQHYKQDTSVTWKTYQVSSYHPMHASFHFINQILQLAYTTQAFISCSPYLCASLVQEFWSSYFPQCRSLFVHVHVQITTSPPKLSYLCTNLSPFVINFHKRYASFDTKGCT